MPFHRAVDSVGIYLDTSISDNNNAGCGIYIYNKQQKAGQSRAFYLGRQIKIVFNKLLAN